MTLMFTASIQSEHYDDSAILNGEANKSPAMPKRLMMFVLDALWLGTNAALSQIQLSRKIKVEDSQNKKRNY